MKKKGSIIGRKFKILAINAILLWSIGIISVVIFMKGRNNDGSSELREERSTSSQSARALTGTSLSPARIQRMLKKTTSNYSVNKEYQSSRHLKMNQSPLLIITYQRANYLAETLRYVYKYVPRSCIIGCPIVVSQDGDNAEVIKVIQEYQLKFEEIGIPLFHIQHDNDNNANNDLNSYQKLAIHYGWALKNVFTGECYNTDRLPNDHGDSSSGEVFVRKNIKSSLLVPIPKRVIILEEDIRIAADFFQYFMTTSKILQNDATLLAVSAFNDNGYTDKVLEPKRLLRSDFFSGLGWMITSDLWNNELASKWPLGYWDDWIRDPKQRQGRQFIHPEISRTFHFGVEDGASQNQFGGNYLSRIKLNDKNIDWQKEDLTYLLPKQFYDQYIDIINHSTLIDGDHKINDVPIIIDQALEQVKKSNVRIEYNSLVQFQQYAKILLIMDDEKAGILRTAYKGVVETRPHGQYLLLLSPPIDQIKV